MSYGHVSLHLQFKGSYNPMIMGELPQTHTAPGLVDIQINGYAGFDFNGDPGDWSGEDFHHVRRTLWLRGVCTALPTLITDEPEAMIARAGRYCELIDTDKQLAGMFPKLHVEGPFICSANGPRGAHPREHCKSPDDIPDLIDRLIEVSGGRVGIVTLAPELPGAIELISRITEMGICVGIGHTQASNEILNDAVIAGAKLSTHLGNGSHQVLPRLDNYVQSQLADDRLYASFISDGHHIPLSTLKNFLRAKTPARSVLITDAISAAESPPGTYNLGDKTLEVRSDGRCSAPGEANLSGSTLSLDRAILNVVQYCDVSFAQAWAMGSTNPARLVNIPIGEEITVKITKDGFTRQG